ncbi:GTP cyclohydrolase II [Candidatus Microgenomates bacterium]|nr:GTP cyclohydrolase II [Candidatus Microgenomates bacterium]
MKQIQVIKAASSKLPTRYGQFELIIYHSLPDGAEHAVLLKEKKGQKATLARIHSQCLTGDTFFSLKCDCGGQLAESMKKIQQAKAGIIIYLNQEGRGIGLTSKVKAYKLQEHGLDTVEANETLGFAPDERDYQVAAEILLDLKIKEVTLLTNNPDKERQLAHYGIKIKNTIPLEIHPTQVNVSYLATKKKKMGHRLRLV